MGQRVAFATSNWKNRPGKPANRTQAEWDAQASSKFNGFPFPIVETPMWDGVTLFNGRPSASSSQSVAVVGPPANIPSIGAPINIRQTGFPVGFTLDEMIKIFWRIKKINIKFSGIPSGSSSAPWDGTAIQEVQLDLQLSESYINFCNEDYYTGNYTCYDYFTTRINNISELTLLGGLWDMYYRVSLDPERIWDGGASSVFDPAKIYIDEGTCGEDNRFLKIFEFDSVYITIDPSFIRVCNNLYYPYMSFDIFAPGYIVGSGILCQY